MIHRAQFMVATLLRGGAVVAMRRSGCVRRGIGVNKVRA
jgi:hypothetical protein